MSAELVIVGAGPAGVSAALWARSRDIEALVLEARDTPGGQLHDLLFTPRELAGLRRGTGPEIAREYVEQLREARIPVRCGILVARLEPHAGPPPRPVLVSGTGERIEADAILVASGVRRRRLDVPGERELEGRGVSLSATRDRERLRGKPVAVVGGGDGAFENALILAAAGCDVALLVRGAPRARREFRDRVAAEPRVRVLERTRVRSILGDTEVHGVAVEGPRGLEELHVAAVVIKVGELPNTEWCRGPVTLDPEGFVVVDGRFRTSQPGVWAAGDVIRPTLPALPVAMGTAALAVADIHQALRA